MPDRLKKKENSPRKKQEEKKIKGKNSWSVYWNVIGWLFIDNYAVIGRCSSPAYWWKERESNTFNTSKSGKENAINSSHFSGREKKIMKLSLTIREKW